MGVNRAAADSTTAPVTLLAEEYLRDRSFNYREGEAKVGIPQADESRRREA